VEGGGPAPSELRHAWLIARPTFRDSARRRGSWTVTLMTGVLFTILILVTGSASERLQGRAESISFGVAVQGDVAGASHFLDQLGDDQLEVTLTDDASGRVADQRSAVGLVLPERLDDRLAHGETIELQIFDRQGQSVSREARNTLLLKVQEIELAGLPTAQRDAGPRVVVDSQQVRRDERVNRLQFARLLAALSAILCLGVVSSVAAILGRSRERRSLEPLLLLPCRRTTVAAGTAAGALPVAVLQLVVATTLLAAASTLPVVGLHLSLGSIVPILGWGLVGAALLGGLACAVGTLAGVLGSGSDDAVSVGDFFALPFVAVGLLLLLRPDVSSSILTSAIPILGPALLVRDGGAGELSIVQLVVALASTAGWCWLLLRAAGRRLAGERSVARSAR
jgi:ABC-type Na+ efflux pump permease subunit